MGPSNGPRPLSLSFRAAALYMRRGTQGWLQKRRTLASGKGLWMFVPYVN